MTCEDEGRPYAFHSVKASLKTKFELSYGRVKIVVINELPQCNSNEMVMKEQIINLYPSIQNT